MDPPDSVWGDRFLLTRRQVLLLGAVGLLSGCSLRLVRPEGCEDNSDPQCLGFELFRLEDNFSAHLEIYGFEIKSFFGNTCLTAKSSLSLGSRRFVFIFPPQHYPETVIERPDLDKSKIGKTIDGLLEKVGLLAAKPSKLVFDIPMNEGALPIRGKAMPFDLPHLLAWDKFNYVLENAEDPYEGDGELADTTKENRQYVLGVESWKGKGPNQTSAIDLPAGFYLQPLKDQQFRWKSHANPKRTGDFTEFWSAFITGERAEDINFELVDIWGVAGGLKGKPSGSVLSYRYSNTKKRLFEDVPILGQLDDNTSSIQFEASPLSFFDRMDIAVTLSPRFQKDEPSDREVGLDYVPGAPKLDECEREKTLRFKPCYDVDHFLTAKTYGISADGGWLDVQGNWSVRPGCMVKGWVQKTVRGRDAYVKVVRKGWLYPFGVEAELVEETERTYIRDSVGHLVAPLVRQIYVRLVPPAFILGSSVEECFISVQILTERTPPLDSIEIKPPPESPIQHKHLDAFVPQVSGSAFNFELQGIDHNKQKVQWAMPLFFISNRQTSEKYDGRFLESASESPVPNNDGRLKNELHYVLAVRTCGGQDTGAAVNNFIKLVDILWAKLPYRFAKLNGQIVGLAPQDRDGDTSVEVKWVEWVRGRRVDPLTDEDKNNGFKFVTQPIRPRIRTARIALQGLRQFSGQIPDMLATYRDMRIQRRAGEPQPLEWTLDPEEDQEKAPFNAGLLDPNAPYNQAGAFMCVLPVEGKETRESPPERRTAVLNTYYRLLNDSSTINELFESLGNTVEYGEHKTTAELGACRPDSKIALLTREYGPLGDEYQDRDRLSKALNVKGAVNTSDLNRFTASGNSTTAGIVNLGMDSLFGAGAEIIPGVKFSDVINYVLQTGGTEAEKAAFRTEGFDEHQEGDNGPVWKTTIVGAEGLLTFFESGPKLERLRESLAALAASPVPDEPLTPISVGMESTLDWETSSFKPLLGSFFSFSPKRSETSREARFIVHARAWTDFLDPKPQVSAVSKLTDFTVEFLDAIVVEFDYVRFEVDSSGRQVFDPAIASVSFKGRLAFIDGLRSLLKSLGDELGIKINITPQRVSVSQTIAFPPQGGSQVVFLGPATISNLSFSWSVIIPIIGRDRMRIAVALASRENPMTIAVGIYGGRAYALIEADTNGPRLIEIYADYGGVFQAEWSGIAKGTVSLTAGFGLSISSGAEGSVQLIAFSQFSGRVDIWIFSACANVIVGLGYKTGSGNQAIFGLAKCSCSFSLGLFEYKYSYEVYKEECNGGCNRTNQTAFRNPRAQGEPFLDLSTTAGAEVQEQMDWSGSAHPPQAIRVDYFRPFEDLARRTEWKEFFDASIRL